MTKTAPSALDLSHALDYPQTPFVSVILPIYNEQHYIVRCLDAIQRQHYPAASIEIVVVDGFSTDDSRALVRQMAAADKRITLLDNPERLQAQALNYGVKAAKGQIIIRVDGHVLIAPDYVGQCVRLLRELASQNVVNVGGAMRPLGENKVGQAVAAATQSPFGIPTAFHHSSKAQFVDTVYLGAWPRTLFDKIGPINPALKINEDYEFNYRTRAAGGKIYLSPDIHSVYFCRSTFPALWRQYFSYGRHKIQMLRRYPQAIRARQLVAPIFVAALLGLPILTIFIPLSGLLWLLMLITYFGVAFIAAWKAPRSGASVLHTLLALAILHTAWGTGFWVGLGTLPLGHAL